MKWSSGTAWHHNYGVIVDLEAGTEIHKHKNSFHKQPPNEDTDRLRELKRKQRDIIFAACTVHLGTYCRGCGIGV